MARYIVDNPDSYIFSALTASVNAEVRFESLAERGRHRGARRHPDHPDVTPRFVINDGQHRRAAIAAGAR